jgi:hypothetical protein
LCQSVNHHQLPGLTVLCTYVFHIRFHYPINHRPHTDNLRCRPEGGDVSQKIHFHLPLAVSCSSVSRQPAEKDTTAAGCWGHCLMLERNDEKSFLPKSSVISFMHVHMYSMLCPSNYSLRNELFKL